MPKWEGVDTRESHLTIIYLSSLMSQYFTDNYTNYTLLCTIKVDLSRASIFTKAKGKGGFYHIALDIILLFAMTELQAQVAWKENVSCLHIVQSNRYRINFTHGF